MRSRRPSPANFCRFSIDGTANRDYVGDRHKVSVSRPYLLADLGTLQPATIILPRGIWAHGAIQTTLLKEAPGTLFLTLSQFNRRVVNIHFAKHDERARALGESLRGTVLASWAERLKGYRDGRPYRFLVEMEDMLATPPSSSPRL